MTSMDAKRLSMGACFAGLLLTACTPRVIERVKPVPYAVPVAAPCPLPGDVLPRPVKPSDPLPDDAVRALAIVMGQLVLLDSWAGVAEAQLRACSQVSSNP